MLFSSLFYFFSIYEGPFEKRVDQFLAKVNSKKPHDLEKLMQEDLVRLSIFLEYKYKGYHRLKRSYRRLLYANSRKIQQDFFSFLNLNHRRINAQINQLHLSLELKKDLAFNFIFGILSFLKQGARVRYREASTFEKLLRDPQKEVLVGDCNQLVTLYTYLFATRFPLSLLQVKLMPGHICLHYKGVDIETTSATLTHYPNYKALSPVTELVAVNLLDISDPDERQFEIQPPQMLQAAQLAYKFSSHRPTVENNLTLAYRNLTLFFLKKNSFKLAHQFADKAKDSQLQKYALKVEGLFYLSQKAYAKALKKFLILKDRKAELACYEAELADLIQKMNYLKTPFDFKKFKPSFQKMKTLALKTGHQKVVKFVDQTLKEI